LRSIVTGIARVQVWIRLVLRKVRLMVWFGCVVGEGVWVVLDIVLTALPVDLVILVKLLTPVARERPTASAGVIHHGLPLHVSLDADALARDVHLLLVVPELLEHRIDVELTRVAELLARLAA